MNLTIKRILFAVLIIVNCIVIFNFSAQDSEESSETSGVVVNRVVNTIANVNKKAEKESLSDKVTFIVRKLAHFSIYTLLGIWLMCFVNTFSIETKKKLIICVILGMLYAISDEIHQHYVGGRSPEIRDVCIDTIGVLVGSVIVIYARKIFKKKKVEE